MMKTVRKEINREENEMIHYLSLDGQDVATATIDLFTNEYVNGEILNYSEVYEETINTWFDDNFIV